MKVKLQEIIEGMEMQTGDHHHYFDKKTGQVVLMGDEEFRAAEDEEPKTRVPMKTSYFFMRKDKVKAEEKYRQALPLVKEKFDRDAVQERLDDLREEKN